MVHTFEKNGVCYLFDNVAGALHACDALTAEVVKKRAGEPYDLGGASAEEIAEIEKEINELVAEGTLFAKEDEEIPLKSNLIKALCLHVSHDCNLRCEYCFAGQGLYKGEAAYMSFDVAKAAIDFLIKNSGDRKILETDFFGGEPLMNMDVVKKTVDYAKTRAAECGKKFLFTLTTNALLLNEENAEYLNREMENVVLSVDGRREVHDGVRKTPSGKGSYDIIIENIKNFVKMRGDKHYYVRGTFTKKNLDFAADVLCLADMGLGEISLEPVVTDKSSALYIGKEDLPQIAEEYDKLAAELKKRRRENRGTFNFFHFQIDLKGGPCLKKRVSACGAGNEYFSIVPNGDIYPCHQFAGEEKYRMGNVFAGKIDEDLRAVFRDNNLYTRKLCKDCFAKYHCSGGCAANNIHFGGDINWPYEVTCGMMKARMECALDLYAEEISREK